MKTKEVEKTVLKIERMSCASCAQTVEKALNNTKNVESAEVNFATNKAYIKHKSDVDKTSLISAVENSV